MNNNFEDLLLVLSQTLVEQPPWESFLRAMERFFDCQNCVLFLRTPTEADAGLIISQERTVSTPAEIVETYHGSPFLQLTDGEICSLKGIREQPERYHQFNGYLEFHNRWQTTDILAINIKDEDSGTHFYFRLVRYSHPSEFSEDDHKALQKLYPHLKAAAAIYGCLVNQKRQIYLSDKTTTTLGFGFLVLKSNGQIVQLNNENKVMMLNSAAARLIKNQYGIGIKQGKLVFLDKEANAQLQTTIARLLDIDSEEESYKFEVPATRDGDNNLLVMINTFSMPPEFGDSDGPLVSLVIRDKNEKPNLSAEVIAGYFDFTPAESLLVERLIMGDSLAESAEYLGRSKSTVRAQLSSIFSKTGTHKQHQLISLIMHTVGSY
ncbi:helix-turn-helix transcriptional regulator [Halioxenophilus sp. WMMB6]|uniref:helix-turn-helix transcriptional regulator n=1 Tax=Halioxenophilus sp. WMMB6 TaxID=3073815 RepID=UPI00295E439B|nr:helix-turn-helix transcriptional regulator [Halioxenophilus sp. WMMB6]